MVLALVHKRQLERSFSNQEVSSEPVPSRQEKTSRHAPSVRTLVQLTVEPVGPCIDFELNEG